MKFKKLLIANRGEIAIRIARAARGLELPSVAIHSSDDATSLHVRAADESIALDGSGVAAYLDIERVVAAALAAGCDAVHPGYGFLAENAAFALRCAAAGLHFVGPSPELLDTFGDKIKARALAAQVGVPLLRGTTGPTSLEQAAAFLESLGDGGAMMIKAVFGGGGRGVRPVHRLDELAEAYARCQSEAQAAFGRPEVYVERLIERARHVEVQVIGDATGEVSHLWERDCTLQRRNQKLVEFAPSPGLDPALRERLLGAAVAMARAAGYRSLGTFEFLVDTEAAEPGSAYAFMEANPRLQVEHTVTEAVTGIDLVQAQIRIAAGATLDQLGLRQAEVPAPRGVAIQFRVNMETMAADGSAKPSAGPIAAFEPPCGPGVRVDTYGYGGYRTNPNFDSLLAKVIVHAPGGLPQAVGLARRALGEFRIDGLATNLAFLRALIGRDEVAQNAVYTRFVEDHAAELVAAMQPERHFEHGAAAQTPAAATAAAPAGTVPLAAPMSGKLVLLEVVLGGAVRQGQQIAILESMKMEHGIRAAQSGYVRGLPAEVGAVVYEGDALVFIEPADTGGAVTEDRREIDPDFIRPDLAEVVARRAALLDDARPEAVAKRRRTGHRTARENMAAVFDDGEYTEYGDFVLAAQRDRRTPEELRKLSPADGMIAGIGCINGDQFGEETSRALGMAYDFTVLAGTQGFFNHSKKDRMLELAKRWQLPLILFAEGGGGRPGDTDWDRVAVSYLHITTFTRFAELSALVPIVGVVSGRCFAGNAALLGCADVIIATPDANIGMAGPAMIEGGGLGAFKPEDVGPVSVQMPNGTIDLLVPDEVEGAAAARRYLSYFQGSLSHWQCPDQRLLRQAIPENRLRVYDIRVVIEGLADTGSVMELRRDFGIGMITALVRIEGRPFGLIANNPVHLGGAIDAEGADKAARFMQLCDAFDLPMLSLCDTPGFMVGPEIEKRAQVRHVSRMFVVGASMTVPIFCIILRKGYGLGAQSMMGGGTHAPFFTVAWPSGELGPMGLEGAVRLGFKKELEAVADPAQRQALFDSMVAKAYTAGKALNVAAFNEVDSVIDPRDTRDWIMRGIRSIPKPPPRTGKKRPCVDTW
ncbi:MAG: carbamoyl-phosphate synthase large subunit [Nevskia sp.]|nr:carbamoyl-phosphate synthase large subunit [Nevskia sp.]